MLREWLLIAWVGTTTNFSLLEVHWDKNQCHKSLDILQKQLGYSTEIHLQCVQDMREGRSAFATRPGGQGIVK
jgi:hypothetical protein